jgi:hypothetical protein
VEFNPELLAWLQPHLLGVGVANQQVSIAVHPGAEFGLTPF